MAECANFLFQWARWNLVIKLKCQDPFANNYKSAGKPGQHDTVLACPALLSAG